MSTVFDRVPPFSLEAEQSVLGAMFLEREAVLVAAEILQPEDFYRDAHRYIFEAILELEEKGRPADLVTVTETLATVSPETWEAWPMSPPWPECAHGGQCRILCPDCRGEGHPAAAYPGSHPDYPEQL